MRWLSTFFLYVLSAVVATVVCVLGFKVIHDQFLNGRERLVRRYVEIIGRISALVIGTFAVPNESST